MTKGLSQMLKLLFLDTSFWLRHLRVTNSKNPLKHELNESSQSQNKSILSITNLMYLSITNSTNPLKQELNTSSQS